MPAKLVVENVTVERMPAKCSCLEPFLGRVHDKDCCWFGYTIKKKGKGKVTAPYERVLKPQKLPKASLDMPGKKFDEYGKTNVHLMLDYSEDRTVFQLEVGCKEGKWSYAFDVPAGKGKQKCKQKDAVTIRQRTPKTDQCTTRKPLKKVRRKE